MTDFVFASLADLTNPADPSKLITERRCVNFSTGRVEFRSNSRTRSRRCTAAELERRLRALVELSDATDRSLARLGA